MLLCHPRTAFLMLENPAVTRDRDLDLKGDLYKMLALCCAKYNHALPITTSLIHSLLKFEHTPAYLAEAVALVATKHDDVQLATAVLREIGRMDPKELLRDAAGAKNVGGFLTELADRLPKVVARNFSVIMVHMSGEQYLLRSALVTVLGRIVARAFDEKEENAAAEQARLKSKQALLDVLLERVRDVNSFTRTRVLQTWTYLCEENQVHLGLFNRVTEIATGRLEDKASNVRRAALQLLSTLIVCNPFAPDLRVAPYESTLRTFQEKLDRAEEENRPSDEELLAAAFGPESGGTRSENGTEQAAENETEQTPENGEAADAPGDKEPEAEDGAPADLETEPKSQASQQESESNFQLTQPEAPTPEQGAANLTKLRAMVASLDAAVKFTKQLGKTMPVFDKLLSSASVTDVTETIQFLELAKSRKCEDVDDRLKLMLPLVREWRYYAELG
jgi:condensin complex subunit 1